MCMTNEGRNPCRTPTLRPSRVYVIGPNFEVVREIEKVIIANVEDEDFAYALDKDEEYNLKVVARRMSSPLPKPSAAPRP
jgi:hypothetical protein